MGIDPGTAIVGWAVLEECKGCVKPVAFGHITTSPKNSTAERLLEVVKDLEEIIAKFEPHEAAVEDLFFFKNLKTVMKVSQARGSILLTLERFCVSIFEYTPLQVKHASLPHMTHLRKISGVPPCSPASRPRGSWRFCSGKWTKRKGE